MVATDVILIPVCTKPGVKHFKPMKIAYFLYWPFKYGCQLIRKEKDFNNHVITKEVMDILEEYTKSAKETDSGKHGLTTQYWMDYINIIHLYHDFSRSIRTDDLDLYIFCIPKITDYFFAFNHPNYARWLVRYHNNLLQMGETHPELHVEFKKGCFALKI